MSEDQKMEVVEPTEEQGKQVEVLAEEEEIIETPAVVVEPKKKRKRSPAQMKALANARKSKAQKKRKVLKRPLKIEARALEAHAEASTFSWTSEICKVSLLGALGLASVYVQRRFDQDKPTSPVVEKSEEHAPKKKLNTTISQNKVVASKDPFVGFR